jgi:hypothetical protein
MSGYRNPFRLRASDRIESDSTFLGLFSPGVIEALIEKHNNGELWNNILFIHSSPGGGKTSILRIFLPQSLNSIYSHRSQPEYKRLFNPLKKLDAISNQKINILGCILSCTRNMYSRLEDIPIDSHFKESLFITLINARVFLTLLRELKNLRREISTIEDLSLIEFRAGELDGLPKDFPKTCSGYELYQWAENLEAKISDSIGGFRDLNTLSVTHHYDFFSLALLKAEFFKINGKPVTDKILLMFDDAHKLTRNQRRILKEYLIERRANVNIWISERLEALSTDELLPKGAYIERDYVEINLEDYWSSKPGKFESTLTEIADKRIRYAADIQVNSFSDCLESALDESAFDNKLQEVSKDLFDTILSKTQHTSKFDEWIEFGSNFGGSNLEKALLLQQIDILISRQLKKSQLSFEFHLSAKELEESLSSGLKSAAEFFLARKFDIPYYYGLPNITKLSSANIEQFLNLSADLFEEISSKSVLGEQPILSAEKQAFMLKRIVEKRWSDINRAIPYGKQVTRFLTAFGNFALNESTLPNAPYSPGVTGIGIKSESESTLIEYKEWIEDEAYRPLINVLASCVAYNLVKIELDKSQGKKGDKWMIIYLNRWLCIKFGLPYQYGGWRQKNPKDLIKWII